MSVFKIVLFGIIAAFCAFSLREIRGDISIIIGIVAGIVIAVVIIVVIMNKKSSSAYDVASGEFVSKKDTKN